ncbi:hypothetical protein H2200_001154 [Cladophialophora chaetospira]|uniref:BTB domain-containing protein n=1 Tax=Cladophialophora chaetospira TaxID=386627 RepID=A0AA38XL49_9EURO|nr:hypothetical protein H2200_001154 [Cladophialophora chaetospira]
MALLSVIRSVCSLRYPGFRNLRDSGKEITDLVVVDEDGDLIIEVGIAPQRPQDTPVKFDPLAHTLEDADILLHIPPPAERFLARATYMPGAWFVHSPENPHISLFGRESNTSGLSSDVHHEQLEAESPTDAVPTADTHPDWAEQRHTQPEDPAEPKVSCLRILISSKLLTVTSPVFKAMLHGGFAEALLPLSTSNPPTLILPEDDTTIFLLLCQVIYAKPGIYKYPIYEQLEGIALLCDKYMCADALRGWFRMQVFFFQERNTLKIFGDDGFDAPKFLKLGYLMDDRDIFSSATNTFITTIMPADTRILLNDVFGGEPPDRLVDMIEAFQYEHIRRLTAIGPALLEELVPKPEIQCYTRRPLAVIPGYGTSVSFAGDRSNRGSPKAVVQSGEFQDTDDIGLCHGRVKRIGVLSVALTSMSLLPSLDKEIDSMRTPYAMIDALKRIAGVNFQDEKLQCPKSSSCACHTYWNINDEINTQLHELSEDTMCGICLACLKDSTVDIASFAANYTICIKHKDYHDDGIDMNRWARRY